jgi:hypothetical protein
MRGPEAKEPAATAVAPILEGVGKIAGDPLTTDKERSKLERIDRVTHLA